jgi:hypothetical protein
LDAAVRKCDEWAKTDGAMEATIIKAQTLGERAIEEGSPKGRSALWHSGIHVLDALCKGSPTAEAAEAYADLAVDCFQDAFSDLDVATCLGILRKAEAYLDAGLKELGLSEQSACLLASGLSHK